MGAACMDAGDRRFGVVRRAAFALAALAVVSIALAARADAYVYWTHLDTESIGLDYPYGTGVNPNFIPAGSDVPRRSGCGQHVHLLGERRRPNDRPRQSGSHRDQPELHRHRLRTDRRGGRRPAHLLVEQQREHDRARERRRLGRQPKLHHQQRRHRRPARRRGGGRGPHLLGEQPKQPGGGEPDDRPSQPRRIGRQPELHHGRQHTRGDRGWPRRHLLVEHRSPRGLDRTRQQQRRRRQPEPQVHHRRPPDPAVSRFSPRVSAVQGSAPLLGELREHPRSGRRISTARAPKVPSSPRRRQ